MRGICLCVQIFVPNNAKQRAELLNFYSNLNLNILGHKIKVYYRPTDKIDIRTRRSS